jgi:hypothetical protein
MPEVGLRRSRVVSPVRQRIAERLGPTEEVCSEKILRQPAVRKYLLNGSSLPLEKERAVWQPTLDPVSSPDQATLAGR